MTYLKSYMVSEPEDSEHQENEEEEAKVKAALAKVFDQDLLPLDTEEAKRLAKRTQICSCGYFTCGMIYRYGLPVPTFTSEIEPIQSQYERDMRALQLRKETCN